MYNIIRWWDFVRAKYKLLLLDQILISAYATRLSLAQKDSIELQKMKKASDLNTSPCCRLNSIKWCPPGKSMTCPRIFVRKIFFQLDDAS